MPVLDLCRKHEVSKNTYYTWKQKYGSMEVSDVKRFKELEIENASVGEWEVDTVIGRFHHQGIVTLADRHSKFTLMKKVPSKHAEPVKQAIVDLFKPVKAHTLIIMPTPIHSDTQPFFTRTVCQ